METIIQTVFTHPLLGVIVATAVALFAIRAAFKLLPVLVLMAIAALVLHHAGRF